MWAITFDNAQLWYAYAMPPQEPRRPKHHFPWIAVILAVVALIAFVASAPEQRGFVNMMTGGSYGVENSSPVPPPNIEMMQTDGSAASRIAPDYYPYPSPNVPASDTRELLKVNYNATMQTRDVQGLTRRVETTVRGHSGRIDNISSAKEYGYVSFVVPMSKYDAFRTELESLVGSRFLSVDIQSQNMLPQKQSIEEQQKQAEATLADQKAARQRIVNAHASTVKSLQGQIDADAQQLAILRAQTPTYEIQVQIQQLSNDWSSLKAQLADENASYSYELSNADANIKYAQDWQTAVKTQDKALMDDVATVSGSVSIQWISLWQMAQLYLPGYWIPAIFAGLALLSYLWDRRRFGTV